MQLFMNLSVRVDEKGNVARSDIKVIAGLGETGLSVARYLHGAGAEFVVLDDAPLQARLEELRMLDPGLKVEGLNSPELLNAGEIILSPGISRVHPAVVRAVGNGVRLTSDVAMFGEIARAPIVGITGSNGKSTVTTLVGMLAGTGIDDVRVAGNIGTPVLDVLDESTGLYVLELSSYQLELATRLPLRVAALLNLSPDHLDRYSGEDDYYQAKANIFNCCEIAVVNRNVSGRIMQVPARVVTFGIDSPGREADFGLDDQGEVLMHGNRPLLHASELMIRGPHNLENALAALAIGDALGLDMDAMLAELVRFRGLPHRCEWLGEFDGVGYVNDSKATNPGATLSAIEAYGRTSRVLLILGGEGKGADFSVLGPVIDRSVAGVFVFGSDREDIADSLQGAAPVSLHDDLEEVLAAVRESAVPGDVVLFSPACASFDMFDNYQVRGDAFRRLVAGES